MQGPEREDARDGALYASAKDLYATRDSVNEGWDDASEFLSNTKERPRG